MIFSFIVCYIAGGTPNVIAARLIDKYQILYTGEAVAYEENPAFRQVLSQWQSEGVAPASGVDSVEISAEQYTTAEGEIPSSVEINGITGLLWEDTTDRLTWEIDIPDDGLYHISLEYCMAGGTGLPAYRSLTIDGETPFREAQNIPFYRLYQDGGVARTDSNGDEVAGMSIEFQEFRLAPLEDREGRYGEPLLWKFAAGAHRLTLAYVDQPMIIRRIVVHSPEVIPSYQERLVEYQTKGYQPSSSSLHFEAEDPQYIGYKTHSTIASGSDGDPATSPNIGTGLRINVMGGLAWRDAGQTISYTLSVPESGLYQIALRTKQVWNNGQSSYRQIRINGKVPFQEMLAYEFPYRRQWYTEILSDTENVPYQFYLHEGDNTLSFTVKMSENVSLAVDRIEKSSEALSQIYRKILLVTGPEPDVNYDYELHKSIPDLLEALEEIRDMLQNAVTNVRHSAYQGEGVSSRIQSILQDVEDMLQKPNSIQKRLGDIVTNLSEFGSILTSLKSSPLCFDDIGLYPTDIKVVGRKSTAISRMIATFKNFLNSFIKDYNQLGNIGSGRMDTHIEVWVSRGREWATVLEELIDSDFVQESGTGVKLNVLPSSSLSDTINPLLLSITSGDNPDVILGITPRVAVEYAIRDIVVDLNQFDDFKEIKNQFPSNSFASLMYRSGIFGLPETVNFNVFAYRKDVFSSLKLSVPNTWEETFYRTLPILYQNSMQMAPPTFYTLLYQNGGQVYSDDGLTVALDSPEGFYSFEQYISLYLDLGFPITANFYNRFRTGEMPAGIMDFATYMQVFTAAPELANKWDLAPVPGVRDKDGNIHRVTTGLTATSGILMQNSNKKEEAWEFLKWWMDTPVQTRFGNTVEAQIGPAARWNSANMTAFQSMPWQKSHLSVIQQAISEATDVPNVLGGMITDIAINNSVNLALYQNHTAREALEKAITTIDKEFKRKQQIYSIPAGD